MEVIFMSMLSSPEPAIAQQAFYTGNTTFLFPLQVVRTEDVALFGPGTEHPCGFTLEELARATFQAKTFSFAASPPAIGMHECLPNAFSLDVFSGFIQADTDTIVYPPGSWYTGPPAGYPAAFASRKSYEYQLMRGQAPSFRFTASAFPGIYEIRYLKQDIFTEDANYTVYAYGGLYYPRLIARFAQGAIELVSYRVPGGGGYTVDSNDPRYTLYSGYATFFGKQIPIGDLGNPVAGGPPLNKDPTTMSVASASVFNQQGL